MPSERDRERLTADDLAEYQITYYDQDGTPVLQHKATAAYITAGDMSLPGWTVLKNEHHKPVYLVRTHPQVSIERTTAPRRENPARPPL